MREKRCVAAALHSLRNPLTQSSPAGNVPASQRCAHRRLHLAERALLLGQDGRQRGAEGARQRDAVRCACLPFLHGRDLTVARLYSGYAILVEPPKTTFGKVRRSAAARPHAPLPTPPPATGAQNLLGKSRRRAGRRLHRAAARSHRIALLLHERALRALPPHQPRHDGVKKSIALREASIMTLLLTNYARCTLTPPSASRAP